MLALYFFNSFWFIFPEFLNKIDDKETPFYNLALAVFAILSGFGAVFGFYTSIIRTETAEQGLITDRLNKAVEGLGKNKENSKPVIEVRLGSLYALERIAQDSIRDHIQIMEILCAYIQENSPRDFTKDVTKQPEPIRKDIQVALTIIGRRHKWAGGEKYLKKETQQNYRLDLRSCDLGRAEIDGTNFSKARFDRSVLSCVSINEAILTYASFYDSKLIGSHFWGSDMKYAKFVKADARGAMFSRSDMSCTQLDNIELNSTRFNSTIMKGAYAENGDILKNLTLIDDQIEQMYCGPFMKKTEEEEEEEEEEKKFVRPKHWPNGFTFDFEEKYKEWLEKTYPDLAKNFE